MLRLNSSGYNKDEKLKTTIQLRIRDNFRLFLNRTDIGICAIEEKFITSVWLEKE